MEHGMIGKWRLIEMEQWDQAFIDLVDPGFISIRKGGQGEIRFGAMNLDLDWVKGDDGKAEFSFEGFDEGDDVSGRGWFKIVSGHLTGLIQFYQGEKSGFKADRWSGSEKLKMKHHRRS